MNRFNKIILCSIPSAIFLYVFYLPQLNYYRITRLTGWSNNTMSLLINVISILLLVSFVVLFYFITKRMLHDEKFKYIPTVSWIPFYIVFILINNYTIPITESGDKPSPGTGILLILSYVLLPIILAFIIGISTSYTKKQPRGLLV
ncbi:vacuolar-type H+-ATPase subunit I/STV1 [Paenibacillus intestini]|nr:vacuolar-type H+-ATPase subunit I/STV1 [Paenibacillus intestini]